tara:strand:+ start:720 stop:1025 length:306 start_codon:yes stop_codon:yes gene_type:complete
MSMHTKGPWVTADGYGEKRYGTAVKSIHDDHLICSCTGYYGREGAEANARLIAAAPDLLEALERLKIEITLSDVDMDYIESHFRPHLERAASAIAKARGES